ncbi:hypothetical protein TURU_068538 [Turdus rufiventris]|nr:hypothetical protein TURU_068538 [Turdus rufiventris]
MQLVIKNITFYFVHRDWISLLTGHIFNKIQPIPMAFDFHTRKCLGIINKEKRREEKRREEKRREEKRREEKRREEKRREEKRREEKRREEKRREEKRREEKKQCSAERLNNDFKVLMDEKDYASAKEYSNFTTIRCTLLTKILIETRKCAL